MSKTAVVALGGNAFTMPGQAGTTEEMLATAAVMAAAIDEVITSGWRVVVVHGNGPQVGNLALQQEAASGVPAQPLAILGAMTQGELGSIIVRSINRLRGAGSAVAVVTHVLVDAGDPAFAAPTKPIGPFYPADQADRLAADRGWVVRPDAGRGYRRVVASPEPTGIVEIAAIRALADAGKIVIAAGGGGVPVAGVTAGAGGRVHRGVRTSSGRVRAAGAPPGGGYAEAVIDKDLAARLLATQLGAEALLIVTAVDRVMINFGTAQQEELGALTADQAAKYLADGQFPAGSMGPKVGAALEFLAAGGELAVITSAALLAATLRGAGAGIGTRIEPVSLADPAQTPPVVRPLP